MAPYPFSLQPSVTTVPSPVRRNPAPPPTTTNWSPGNGSIPPEKFNNKGLFALFALLGAAMVLAAIWFFFWAPNGGFHWRKNDWDDYKSTVLRRKGKDGKTLSNATPRTDLGQKSIAGTFDIEGRQEMSEVGSYASQPDRYRDKPRSASRDRRRKHRSSQAKSSEHRHKRDKVDDDVRAYRQERSARVGGMNREHDGSHFDFTNSERSDNMTRYSDTMSFGTPSRPDSVVGPTSEVSNNSRTHLNPKRASPEPPKKKGFLGGLRGGNNKRAEQQQQKKREEERAAASKQKEAKKQSAVKQRLEQRRDFDDDSTVADASERRRGQRASETYYGNMYRPAGQSSTQQHASGAGRGATTHATSAAAARRTERRSTANNTVGQQGYRREERLPRAPGSFDVDAASEAGSNSTGTRSYSTHHIPALSRGSRDTGVGGGFRRGNVTGGRRDSLSDSD